jgi:hypothetical protein
MFYCLNYAHPAQLLIVDINHNINLTIIQDNQITTNQIHACFNIVYHFLYLFSSQLAVTIWIHQIRQITNAINHNIHSTRFIKFIATSISSLDHVFSIHSFQTHIDGSCGTISAFTKPKLPTQTNPTAHKLNKTFLNVFFIFVNN